MEHCCKLAGWGSKLHTKAFLRCWLLIKQLWLATYSTFSSSIFFPYPFLLAARLQHQPTKTKVVRLLIRVEGRYFLHWTNDLFLTDPLPYSSSSINLVMEDLEKLSNSHSLNIIQLWFFRLLKGYFPGLSPDPRFLELLSILLPVLEAKRMCIWERCLRSLTRNWDFSVWFSGLQVLACF